MREIKFRGKIKDGGWVVGGIRFVDDKVFICPNDHSSFEVIPETVGQYTGLYDKSGKKIYEGDIVRYKLLTGFECESEYEKAKADDTNFYFQKPQVVKFTDGEFWPREEYRDVEDGYYSYRYFDLVVIGNIHENPELLTPADK